MAIKIHLDGITITNKYQNKINAVPEKHIPWSRINSIFWMTYGGNDTPRYYIIDDSNHIHFLMGCQSPPSGIAAKIPTLPAFERRFNEQISVKNVMIDDIIQEYHMYVKKHFGEDMIVRPVDFQYKFFPPTALRIVAARENALDSISSCLKAKYEKKRYFNIPSLIGLIIAIFGIPLTHLSYSTQNIIEIFIISLAFMIYGYFTNLFKIDNAIHEYRMSDVNSNDIK